MLKITFWMKSQKFLNILGICHLDVMKTVAYNIARATKTLYEFSCELSYEFSKINCHVNIN